MIKDKNDSGQEPIISLHRLLQLFSTRQENIGIITISVREGILLEGRKKFALKTTIRPETDFFSLIRMGPETSCKSVLYS